MASNSGKPSVTPTPRRNVRRGMCFLERYIVCRPPLTLHLKRRALDDANYQRRKPVVVRRRAPDNGAHHRHIVVLDASAQTISHQLFRDGPHKLIRIAEE